MRRLLNLPGAETPEYQEYDTKKHEVSFPEGGTRKRSKLRGISPLRLVTETLKISETAAMMLTVLGILFPVCLAAGLAVIFLIYSFEQPLPYALGLAAGCLLSGAKVILLERSLNKSVDMEGGMAKNYASLQVVLRYFLTIAVFALVILLPGVFGLFGTIIGVLCLQISAYAAGHWIKKKDRQY